MKRISEIKAARAVLEAMVWSLTQGILAKEEAARECGRNSASRARFRDEADILKRELRYAKDAGSKAIAAIKKQPTNNS